MAAEFFHWDYTCGQCGQTGSCPVPEGTSAVNAYHLVRQAHASFNPACDTAYQGRWLEVFGVSRGEVLPAPRRRGVRHGD